MGVEPDLAIAPSDFSSSVEIPPAILAGIGFIVRISSPVAFARASDSAATARMFAATP